MHIAKWIGIAGLLFMTVAIGLGFALGDFAYEGSQLLAMPWGIVSLVDLYVGFTIYSLWIIYRERSFWRSLVWVTLMMVLGFWTASLYLYLVARQSHGNCDIFFHGRDI